MGTKEKLQERIKAMEKAVKANTRAFTYNEKFMFETVKLLAERVEEISPEEFPAKTFL